MDAAGEVPTALLGVEKNVFQEMDRVGGKLPRHLAAMMEQVLPTATAKATTIIAVVTASRRQNYGLR